MLNNFENKQSGCRAPASTFLSNMVVYRKNCFQTSMPALASTVKVIETGGEPPQQTVKTVTSSYLNTSQCLGSHQKPRGLSL